MSELTEKQIIDLFKDAPDDCVGAITAITDVQYPHGRFITDDGDCDRHYGRYCGDGDVYACKDTYYFTPRPANPVTSPTFTQAMADNGELPPIGSRFIDVELNLDEEVEAIAHDIELGRVIYKRGSTLQDSEYFGAVASECKPLTPPIELIDGKAYQFQHQSCRGLGFYNERLNEFSSLNHTIDIERCINIKPLTVEGKS